MIFNKFMIFDDKIKYGVQFVFLYCSKLYPMTEKSASFVPLFLVNNGDRSITDVIE